MNEMTILAMFNVAELTLVIIILALAMRKDDNNDKKPEG